jgi:pilus assembly protein Flp/PilA
MNSISKNLRAFAADEEGIALSEYLILLGLLVGGVIATVGIAGTSLDGAWTAWSTFWDGMGPDGAGEEEGEEEEG